MTLQEIWKALYDNGHYTDKGPLGHDYLPTYERLLEPVRSKALRLLEIGIARGYSLEMWRAYLPRAEIVGLDTNLPVDIAGVTVIRGDVTIPDTTAALGYFDVIIDDASHALDDQVAAFRNLEPQLLTGGLYVIEDIPGDDELKTLMQLAPFASVVDLRESTRLPDSLLLVYRKEPR